MRILFGRKKKGVAIDEKAVSKLLRRELGGYVTREQLREYLDVMSKDEGKRKLWDSLPDRKKVKVLRYVSGKKREQYGKK